MFKILYRLYRFFSWLRYGAGRRFTPAGWVVLIALMASATMGIDTDNTVAYQGFTPLLFLLLMAFSFGWLFRARFSAVRSLPRFGTVGQPVHYRVTLKNLSAKSQSDLTLLENMADPRPSYSEWKAVQLADERRVLAFPFGQRRRRNPFKLATAKSAVVPPVRPNEEIEVQGELTPLRRGIIRFSGVTLARPDPFGLFRAMCRIPSPQSMLVLPKRYLLPPIALPGTMKYQEGGVALASSIGQSDEFVSLRDYRRGDPMRHIHWRSWAKTGKPIVKEFEDEFFVRHALVLDTFTDDPHGDVFEDAVSVAASFACTIRIQESLLDLLFIGEQAYCFTAGRGLAHADQMLEILASVSAAGDKPFRTLEHLVIDHSAVVSGCICVLLGWDRKRREFIGKLRALGLPMLVLVVCESGKMKSIETAPVADKPERFHILEAGRIEECLAKIV
jgi:uncharacterized protein (DUF58 family)